MNEPASLENQHPIDQQPTKRKRRYKIFDSKPKLAESQTIIQVQYTQSFGCQSLAQVRKQLTICKPIQSVKIPPKTVDATLEQPEDEIELLQIGQLPQTSFKQISFERNIYQISMGNTFFKQIAQVPSVLVKNHELVINEQSEQFYELKQLKSSHNYTKNTIQELLQGAAQMQQNFISLQSSGRHNINQLNQLEQFIAELKNQQQYFDKRIKAIDHRLENIEFMISLEIQQSQGKHHEQLKIFIEENGGALVNDDYDDDEDTFAQSHYLPAGLIAKYLQERRSRQQQQRQQRQQKLKISRRSSSFSLFHPIFKIQEKQFNLITQYIKEQLNEIQNALTFQLLFRRGTTDLDIQSVGQKEDLQYKANLLFLVKTSTGKRIGGFISNFLIQQEVMQDSHAFLFTLQQQGDKFPIRQQCIAEAFGASKHYLVTFSSDLMLSTNCINEQSYSQWPSSYGNPQQTRDNQWFAGDFQFMIEHIEIYQISPQ